MRRYRKAPARPIVFICRRQFPNGNILHFGRGMDIPGSEMLSEFGRVTDYDPGIPEISNPRVLRRKYKTVVSMFVFNCLPPGARRRAMASMASALRKDGTGFVAVRSVGDPHHGRYCREWARHQDGLKSSAAFQKFYTPRELCRELRRYFGTAIILHGSRNTSWLLACVCLPFVKIPTPDPVNGVGKRMVNCVYYHNTAAPHDLIYPYLRHVRDWNWDVVKIGEKTASFLPSTEFDFVPEPSVGWSLVVLADGRTRRVHPPSDPWIYHHKWLFVRPGYAGFDIAAAKYRSLAWLRLSGVDRRRIGRRSYWDRHVVPRISYCPPARMD